MVNPELRAVVKTYDKFMKMVKRDKIDLSTLSPEIQSACLRLHQLALLIWWYDDLESKLAHDQYRESLEGQEKRRRDQQALEGMSRLEEPLPRLTDEQIKSAAEFAYKMTKHPMFGKFPRGGFRPPV